MKKKLIAIAACAVVASFVTAHTALATEFDGIFEQSSVSAFWKKKDKDLQAPEAAPEVAPQNTPTNAPIDTQEVPKQAPEQDGEETVPTAGAYFVRSNRTTDHAPNQGGRTIGNMENNNYHGIEYVPGINEQIEKILAHKPAIKLDPNAYIVQHDESLWLVMGNIRAKLDILIYVDGKNVNAEFPACGHRGNALPIYK
ncbi:MAG: hypothetical protein FWE21_05875 [Defluviitaleaceae bacterium]|nr:hypothetical protein [Defluviitaleaceae bacterium]